MEIQRTARGVVWSEEMTEALIASYKTTRAEDLARRFGVSVNAIYFKAAELGLRKRNPRWINLTVEQKQWLVRNYPHITNSLCAERLGISARSVVRIARRMGLRKSEEFMRDCQVYTARKAKDYHIAHGTYPPKGVINDNLRKGIEKWRANKDRTQRI